MFEVYKKVSIIVPVYNAEKTIERCIKSILKQTYNNIEIIIVNDGSTDNSLHICYELSKLDKRIIVIDTVNKGVSVARNIGIEKAKGDYIAFVDADDYVKENMYEKMVNYAEVNKVNLVFCNYEEFNDKCTSKKIEQFNLKDAKNNTMHNTDIIKRLISISEDSIFGSCWRTLFSRKLIIDNNIKFTENRECRVNRYI